MPGVSVWWVVAALVGAAATIAGAVWVTRGVARVGWCAAGLLVLVVGALVTDGTATGYLPDVGSIGFLAAGLLPLPAALATGAPAEPPHAATATRGVTWRVRVPSDAPGVGDRYAWVHVPPGYRPDGSVRYPVVYLLAGSPGTGTDWVSAGRMGRTVDALVDDGTLAPTIVVSPDLGLGLDQEPVDRPGGGAALGTFVVRDVVAWADDHLPTDPDAAHRVVGGMSAGSYGAIVDGVGNPDVFGAVVGILPYTRPAEADLRHDPNASTSPVLAIEAAASAGLSPVPVYLVGASRDSDAATTCTLTARLRAAGHPVSGQVLDGRHSWQFARDQLADALRWVAAQPGSTLAGTTTAPATVSGCSAG